MGIHGLQTFMQSDCKDVYEQVKLSEIANLYRSETGRDPVMLIDISSCISYFYNESPVAKTVVGGIKKLKEVFKKFINDCYQLGIKVKVFSDGIRPRHKYNTWKRSTTQQLNVLEAVYSGDQAVAHSRLFCRGTLCSVLHTDLLKHNNLEYSRAIYEADSDILRYLKSSSCFAVLTHDSDFVIFDNIWYCLTAKNSNLDSMTFFNYNRNNLLKFLDLKPSQINLFAGLCFNNSYNCKDLSKFYKKEEIGKWEFSRIAEIVKKFSSEDEFLQHYSSSMQPGDTRQLQSRLNFYNGIETEDMRLIKENEAKQWSEILKSAEKRHTTGKANKKILEILTKKVNFISLSWENVLRPLPGTALLSLRKKIYGILFFEYPKSNVTVKELMLECPGEGLRCVHREYRVGFYRRFHPGLLELWSSCKSGLEMQRKKVFCAAINEKLSVSAFCSLNIPEEYLFPVLVAFYFTWELDKKVEVFEVKSILLQAVLANNLTPEQIGKYPEEFHIEAFDLSAWFMALVSCFELLNSVCGEPFCKFKTNLANFFDGGVFHYVYGKMMEGADPRTLLDSEMYETYETLNRNLIELGRICGHVRFFEGRGFGGKNCS